MNTDYWQSIFEKEQILWGMQPSDSSIIAANFFENKKLNNILIPGIGYGRNSIPFLEKKFSVTGIEISQKAIKLARINSFNFPIIHGSVLDMPFNNKKYDAIFCYALIHLLNKPERKKFLAKCYEKVSKGGYMFFNVISQETEMFGKGKRLSKDRYEIKKGLKVFFYDEFSINKEFKDFGLINFQIIYEPIKYSSSIYPLKCYLIKCKKK